jgi:DNA adenine methylase
MKTPISWYGGKQRIASQIVKLIPDHRIYCEPFCGGAAVFWQKGRPDVSNNDNYREILNDTNKDLINFMRVVQCPVKRADFLDRLDYTLYSREYHEESIFQVKGEGCETDIEWALRFYFVAQASFSKVWGRGWAFDKVGKNSAITFSRKKHLLRTFVDRLEGVFIENLDALECLQRWDHPDAFFYVDPPYPGSDQGHYQGYTQDDFEKLCSVLDTLEGNFLLSCYDNAAPRPNWERLEISTVMSSSKAVEGEQRRNNRRTEVLWMKYKNFHRQEKLPLYQS